MIIVGAPTEGGLQPVRGGASVASAGCQVRHRWRRRVSGYNRGLLK
jgi:hypothetical protein